MDLKLNLLKFKEYLSDRLNKMMLPNDCKNAINVNVVSIFNKANTTLQTDGSEEVLDTFELKAANNDINEYIETYNMSLKKYSSAIAQERAKLHTMFKDYQFKGHGIFPDVFSIIVNNEEMVVGNSTDGIFVVRGDGATSNLTTETYKSLEDLISQINKPDNNFGKLGYKGVELNDVKI